MSTESTSSPRRNSKRTLLAVLVSAAVLAFLISWLLTSVFMRKQEAKNPYLKFVNVSEETTDPAIWGKNWPRQFDSYRRTADVSRTEYGGSEAMPQEKLDRDPWLKKMFSGYAFSIDYRDRRGHAYMLFDQEQTERVLNRPQPGACLHCHASVIPTYRRLGLQAENKVVPDLNEDPFAWPAVMRGFAELSAMKYSDAHAEVLKTPDGNWTAPIVAPGASAPTTREALDAHTGRAHPVSCIDCHGPETMQLRVTRPGFMNGIKVLKASQGVNDYDPNRDASRQEMRTFVCAQCHVEYHFKGPEKLLTYPWANGLKVEDIERYYDESKFTDWKHGVTGAPVLKAQHPEFELWSQGIHARSGVSCADCHMPYKREGALKVSDHWVRSPLLNLNRACQTCHNIPEAEIKSRVDTIQGRNKALLDRAATALVDMMDSIVVARAAGASDAQLEPALQFHRKAQFRLDFIYAENSMGFHAPQEAARILAESIDFARRGQISVLALNATKAGESRSAPEPVHGVTATSQPRDK